MTALLIYYFIFVMSAIIYTLIVAGFMMIGIYCIKYLADEITK